MERHTSQGEVTQLLRRASQGDRESLEQLVAVVHGELRAIAGKLMSGERRDHTLQATALVDEAFLRLIGQQDLPSDSRAHFYGVAANIMRRVLVDHARERGALKRGGGRDRVDLETNEAGSPGDRVDLVGLDDALARLEKLNSRGARLIELRFFGGLPMKDAAGIVGISERQAYKEWEFARFWLKQELGEAVTTASSARPKD